MIPRPPASWQEACDLIAIHHLAASYAEAVSRGAVAEACLTYAVDGVLYTPTTEPAIGRAAVTDTITRTCASLEFVFQTVHGGLAEVDGDTGRARHQITEWARRPDGRAMQFLGVYEDVCVRTGEGWRFASRTLVPRLLGRPDGLGGTLHPLETLPAW